MLQRINSSCRRIVWLSVFILSSLYGAQSWALDPDQFQKQNAFDGMELEDLMGLSISSLSKHQEPVSKAAAAVFVLTGEEIRRSPVTTLVEALRLIPGLNVQRINNTQFYVSIRGFNGPFPRNLLVMVDGRSIYNPLYAGVYWEQRDLPLSIIDRIEVVRGPGGAIWGSNALNGIVNIITKSSNLQQDTEVLVQASDREQQLTAVTGGGKIALDKVSTWRFFADKHQYSRSDTGDDVNDQGQMTRVGVRFDQALGEQVDWHVDTQLYRTETFRKDHVFDTVFFGEPQNNAVDIDGVSINSTFRQQLTEGSEWDMQFFAEYYDRKFESLGREQQSIFDLSAQYRALLGAHHLSVGGNYRGYMDKFTDSEAISFDPNREYDALVSGFIQDQVTLGDQWMLTLGAKYEWHRFQGEFIQPTMRLAWSDDDLTIWLAYSKSIQAQTRDSRGIHWKMSCYCGITLFDFFLISPNTVAQLPPEVLANPAEPYSYVIVVEGEPDNQFETQLYAWEWGVRSRLGNGWVLDFSAYYHHYTNILSLIPAGYRPIYEDGGELSYIEAISHFGEHAAVFSHGADLVLSWRWRDTINWRLAYSYFDVNIQGKSANANAIESHEGDDPPQQISLQNDWRLSDRVQVNTFVRYVDAASYHSRFAQLKSYTTVDSKVSFAILPNVDLFFVGKNLFDDHHIEGRVTSEQPNFATSVERSFTLGVKAIF